MSCPVVAYGAGREVFDAHTHEHPIVNHYVQRTDPGALKIRDNELYQPAGLEYDLTIRVDESTDTCTGVTLRRASRDFSEREREVLTLLRPHLVQAYRLALRWTDLRRALHTPRTRNGSLGPVLSEREAEVLELVALGKNNKDIGRILNSSPRTVGKHLEHLYAKLGVHNRTAAIRWAEAGQRASHSGSDEFRA